MSLNARDRAARAAVPIAARAEAVEFDDVALRLFHLRVAVASVGGVFSDGFGLGIIGTALSLGATRLQLTPQWLGLLGAAALAGLFLGALVTGPAADQFGRRPIFAHNMALLGVLSALQFFVASAGELFALRLLIGFVLGTDYVVSKALLTEFTPRAFRGRILSLLSVAWAGGYTCAYFVGFALSATGAEPWRWMLLASAVPCLAILPVRVTMPESPIWLADHGHSDVAARVVLERLGRGVLPPPSSPVAVRDRGRWRQLVSPAWRRRTMVGCVFFTCLVIPYFAVGTFVARVLAALHVHDGRVGGLVYNLALLAGAVVGLVIVDRIPRRSFLIGSFTVSALAMLGLICSDDLAPVLVITLFAVLAGVLSAASDLVYVYLPELFPTDLRASGIGLAIACSRIGSAASTYLLPVGVGALGIRAALGACMAVLVVGAIVCQRWAPETRHVRLAVVDDR